MERKISEGLLKWKDDPLRKPLIISGPRQVGKTYSALAFGRENYTNVAYLNLESSEAARSIFKGDIDAKNIIKGISAATKESVFEKDTLIIIDEVQTSERALTSMKYMQEQAPDYHLIATGSLLGMTLNRKDYSFPVGKVDMMRMHPMDQEEFMWATGDKGISEMVRESFNEARAMPLHENAMDIHNEYLFVGGMPEAVSAYVNTGDTDTVTSVHGKLNSAYLADMAKYASYSETVRTVDAWNSIPVQLARENKKFQYSLIKAGGRSRNLGDSIVWLEAVGMVNICRRVGEGRLPLKMYEDRNSFKLYMADTGMLCTAYGIPFKEISRTSDESRGAMAENYVMQSLVSNNIDPYYWTSPGKAELDFIFQSKDGSIIPIEVKSGKKSRSRSMGVFTSSYDVPFAIRISAKNMGFENGILSVPLYAAFCIENDVFKLFEKNIFS